MRIIVTSWRDLAHPQAGGSEILVDRLLTGLQGRGHEVALVCGGPIGVHPYPVHEAGGTFSQYLRAPVICSTRFRKYDVLIDVENGLPFFSPLWRRRPSICLVHHIHSDQWRTRFSFPQAIVARAAERTLMPLIYRKRLFVAVSPSTAGAIEEIGVDRGRIRVIENGVDLSDDPTPPKSTAPLFVALSRLVPHKRVDLLLEAWRTVQPETGGRFVIIGDGPQLSNLRRQATGVPGVEMLGHISEDEKRRYLAEAWFLVHGSHHEGWGLAILEAGAVGTPTLALDAPGVRDAVIDGETGLLVRAPEALLCSAMAAGWMGLAANSERRDALGMQARSRAGGFGWERMVDSWLAVISEVVMSFERRTIRHTSGTTIDGPSSVDAVPTGIGRIRFRRRSSMISTPKQTNVGK